LMPIRERCQLFKSNCNGHYPLKRCDYLSAVCNSRIPTLVERSASNPMIVHPNGGHKLGVPGEDKPLYLLNIILSFNLAGHSRDECNKSGEMSCCDEGGCDFLRE
jgi:hypothetical protein